MTHQQSLVLRARRALQTIQETGGDSAWEDVVQDLERRAQASASLFQTEIHANLEYARQARKLLP